MLRWAIAIPLVYFAGLVFVVSSTPPSVPSQPIQFGHKVHLGYFHDGRHRQSMVAMHKEKLLKSLGDEEVVAGIIKDVEGGGCTTCHRDFDQNAQDLPKLDRCGQCHRAFIERDWEGRRDQRPCMGCHNTVADSPRASIPNTKTCAACHVPALGSGQEEMKLVEFTKQERTIPWTRVYDYLPGDVAFSHERHVELRRVKCQECHGPVEQAEQPLSLKVKLSMEGCMACHEAMGADNDCGVCHR